MEEQKNQLEQLINENVEYNNQQKIKKIESIEQKKWTRFPWEKKQKNENEIKKFEIKRYCW